MRTTQPRPLPPDTLAGLGSVAEVCDVLRGWGRPDLAERLAYFASDEDLDDGDVPLMLDSAVGFLAFFGAVESDGTVGLGCSQEGWLYAVWQFTDNRHATLWFMDINQVMFTAGDRAGKFINIRGGGKIAVRALIMEKLIQEGLFTWHRDSQAAASSYRVTT